MMSQMIAKMGKGQYPSINQDDIVSLLLPLPPLEIQRQIVAECEAVDKETHQARVAIKQARESIDSALSDISKENPIKKTLGQICDIQRGRFTHRPRNEPRFFGGKYPFLQTGDVVRAKHGKVEFTQTLNEEGLAVSRLFTKPLVLITIAANIGDTAVLDYPACFTDSVVGLTPKDGNMDVRYLEFVMRTHKKKLNDEAPQMAQKNINIEILRPLLIPVPLLKDQMRFVKSVEEQEARITAAEGVLAATPARKTAILKKHLE